MAKIKEANSSSSDPLATSLSSTCVFQHLSSFTWILQFYICVASGKIRINTFYRHRNHFDFSTGGIHLHSVSLGHIPAESPSVHSGGFRKGSAVSSFRWFGFRGGVPVMCGN